MFTRLKNRLALLHRDQAGMETVQVILIVAISLMFCLATLKLTGVSTSGEGQDSGIFGTVFELAKSLLPELK